MTLVDVLTIIGLILGPASAVGISLLAEGRREKTSRRVTVVRTLLASRINFADRDFQTVINTIPIDFKHDEEVRGAWENYHAQVAIPAADQTEAALRSANERWNKALNELVKSLLMAIGYKERDAASITRAGYVSTASTELRQLQMGALKAVPEVARNTGRLADANEKLIAQALEAQRKPVEGKK